MLRLDDQPITPTMFPDGTSQIWKIPAPSRGRNIITWIFEHEGELMHLAQLRDLLETDPRLWMPYLPYGRQDKDVANDATFALRSFGRQLDAMGFPLESDED